jgi:hypothetical protein
MNLTLETLAANGGFVSRKAVPKAIKLKNEDGEDFAATVYVLPLSYVTAKNDIVATQLKSDPLAARIAHCIVDEEGNRLFTVADVIGEADPERGPFSDKLTHELLRVIGEVSQLGKRRAPSATKTKSGTSSSSTGSAGARSKKRKTPSVTQSSSAG